MAGPSARRLLTVLLLLLGAAFLLLAAEEGNAQVGQLVSPGPLSKAHASLSGIASCQKCHERGEGVTAEKCLACHKPVAQRIAERKGVHRDVKGECASCHAEHAGRDADVRGFDPRGFDHARETGFPLDGLHARLASSCASCHKTRSFLAAKPDCASCHADPHKGALGAACATCHSTAVAFKETRRSFDHARTAFPLTGAHVRVDCGKCHANGVFKGVRFASCADCHKSPHRQAFVATCATCHGTETFRTRKVEHDRTAFPLKGKHATVPCASCHKEPPMKARVKAALCRDCHADPHRGGFPQDCSSCHSENGFRGVPFDHAAKARFTLEGRHADLPCARCHAAPPAGGRGGTASAGPAGRRAGKGAPSAALDFRGLKPACASCHKDPHRGSLGATCASCHSASSFRVTTFRHPGDQAFFAGGHAAASCAACHRGATAGGKQPVPVGDRTYHGLSRACASCHKDPHLGQVGTSCESCHAVDGAKFAPKLFDHAKAAFPLQGRHVTVPCASCHRKETGAFPSGTGTAVRLKGLRTTCTPCHTDVHKGQLGPTCQSCHTQTSFAVKEYRHRGEPGFFVGGHLTAPCAKCHARPAAGAPPRLAGTPTTCGSCHRDPHQGTLGASCATCHSPAARWATASRAFHKATQFPLEGKHLAVPCAACHLNGVTKGTPTRCSDCHWIRKQDDPFRTRLGTQCETCHRPISWKAVTWTHGGATGFALAGAHATLDCVTCHTNGVFESGRGTACVSCHLADYQKAKDPDHVALGFPTQCEVCHRVSDPSWDRGRFDHAGTFPLLGVHATQPCAACHRNGVYEGTARDCAGCHADAYRKTTSPNHIAAGFPSTCETCHKATDSSFTQGKFDHGTWPLQGVHATQACTACHRNLVYKGLPTSCDSCHLPQYQAAKQPDHVAAGFPTTCETCHRFSDPSWKNGQFNHATVFPLMGVHATQTCATCHKNGVYKGTPRDCVGCHLAQYQATKDPNHAAAGFPTTCETCHKATDTAWTQGVFNHATVFPLVGVHATQACASCHKGGVYKGTPRDCAGCHLAQYQATKDPNHAAAGFPTTCETCHKATDTSWGQGQFNHATVFPLVGVHATQACASCHKNGVYKGTPRDCAGCHQAQYQAATNPNHIAAGFASTCESCHRATDATWQQGTYAHTTWPLLGLHAAQACTACHRSLVFKGLPSACSSCHMAQYQATTNPNHVQAGFPTTCETCHKASDTSWQQGTFNHATVFPLVGVHATQPCVACHKNGVYSGTPRDCAGCHLPQYQATTNPNHQAAGFPTTCETCHRATDTSWQQGTFNHTWFPITSGKHAGNPCSACHTSPSNFAVFTCITCHGRTQTDSHHRGVSGYRYDSLACYACHPQGRGD